MNSFQQAQANGYLDPNGNWITTTPSGTPITWTSQYGAIPAPTDWRDQQIANLNMIIANKENALKEAYCEIGRLHEQIRGMTAFNQWSEGIAKNAASAPSIP